MLQSAHVGTITQIDESHVAAGVMPRLAEVVTGQPQAVAVTDADTRLTYAELAARAAGLLRHLRGALARLDPPPTRRGPEAFGAAEPVAMLFGHEVNAVAALVAILASGHPVLVLDPHTPSHRSRRLADRLGIRVVLASPTHRRLAAEITPTVLAPEPTSRGRAEELWSCPPAPTDVAVVAFTSGSTGAPKPVANDHRLLVRDAWNSSIATGCYDQDDVIAHTLPIAFHAGLTTTVHGLLVGATMHLFDTRARGISGLPQFLHDHGCTLMIASPAILRGFCAARPDPRLLTSLRRLTIAGEPAHGSDVAAVMALMPRHCVIRNRYGSSETGLIAEHLVDEQDLTGQIPAGRGVGRTVLDVVDSAGQPVAEGAVGRLLVRAPEVALGYWGMPLDTAASFGTTADGLKSYLTSDLGRRLPTGDITIVGRADHSVKVHGYLVDPGEVDAALFAIPGIREAVTVSGPRPDDHGNRLVAYVVAEPGGPGIDESDIRSALRDRLPAYMVPEAIARLDALPRTERGKIDRSALPPIAPADDDPRHHLRTGWEWLVAQHWGHVLGVDKNSLRANSDFFALGGDSLAAEEIMTRLIDHAGVALALAETRLFVEAPTLGEFARRLIDPTPRHGARWSLPLQENGTRTPLFLVTGAGGLGVGFRALARRLGEDQPSYALQSALVEGRGLPEWSVERMARRRVAQMLKVRPKGPYVLAGHSFGGVVALEMAHQLRRRGEEVSHLIILDSFPPDPSLLPSPKRSTWVRQATFWAKTTVLAATSPRGSRAWRLQDHADIIAPHHHGRPWSGRTLVVVAESPEQQQRSAWSAFLTGEHQIVHVRGDHITMLHVPWVDEVARHMHAFLESTGSTSGLTLGGEVR